MKHIWNFVVSGILVLGVYNSVFCQPASLTDSEEMQADEYDYYSDDQNGSNQQIKPVNSSGPNKYFLKSNVTISGTVGKNITLLCDAKNVKDEVVLWYKNHNLISTGKNPISPYYSLDPKTYDLIILNATNDSQGSYYCELQPQQIRMHTTVIVTEQSIEDIVSKNSNSSQTSLSVQSSNFLIVALSGTFLVLLKL